MKHAASTIWDTVVPGYPKHSTGWTDGREHDDIQRRHAPSTPGRHAKPFAAHHPARPVTYDATGTTTPLNPPTNVLDVAA